MIFVQDFLDGFYVNTFHSYHPLDLLDTVCGMRNIILAVM
jgi:hypothetical protein